MGNRCPRSTGSSGRSIRLSAGLRPAAPRNTITPGPVNQQLGRGWPAAASPTPRSPHAIEGPRPGRHNAPAHGVEGMAHRPTVESTIHYLEPSPPDREILRLRAQPSILGIEVILKVAKREVNRLEQHCRAPCQHLRCVLAQARQSSCEPIPGGNAKASDPLQRSP